MPDASFERDDLLDLATDVARGRETARRLGMPFAERLLDMCLVEIVLVSRGREKRTHVAVTGEQVESTLQVKLRLAVVEREAAKRG